MFQQDPKYSPAKQCQEFKLTSHEDLSSPQSKCEDPEITSHHVKTLSSSQCEDPMLVSQCENSEILSV